MEQIVLTPTQESYGSSDQTPQLKHRPLSDIRKKGRYWILKWNSTKLIVFGPHWPLFVVSVLAFMIFSTRILKNMMERGMDIRIGIAISVIQIFSFLAVGTAEPGISNDEQLNHRYQNILYELSIRPSKERVWYQINVLRVLQQM